MTLRMEIFLKLKNSFDYNEFLSACTEAGVQALPPGEFAQKAGMLKVACNMYPDMTPKEAYLKFVENLNTEYSQKPATSEISPAPPGTTGCGGCGGGKVR